MIWWLILAGLTLGVIVERERFPRVTAELLFIRPTPQPNYHEMIEEMEEELMRQLRPRKDLWR